MTDERQELLVRRFVLVGEECSLNAEALRLRVRFSSAEVEVLRIKMETGSAPGAGHPVQDLHLAEQAVEAIKAEQGDCDERIAAVEADMADIDRRLAALDGTGGGRT